MDSDYRTQYRQAASFFAENSFDLALLDPVFLESQTADMPGQEEGNVNDNLSNIASASISLLSSMTRLTSSMPDNPGFGVFDSGINAAPPVRGTRRRDLDVHKARDCPQAAELGYPDVPDNLDNTSEYHILH